MPGTAKKQNYNLNGFGTKPPSIFLVLFVYLIISSIPKHRPKMAQGSLSVRCKSFTCSWHRASSFSKLRHRARSDTSKASVSTYERELLRRERKGGAHGSAEKKSSQWKICQY
jgi:hypothetical protein